MEKRMGIELYKERKKRIQKLNLTSDLLSSVVFEDAPALQDVLRILTDIPDLKVIRTEPQRSFRNLYGHGTVSDVWAEDEKHTQYNIEIQIAESEEHLKRSRFIQSRIDSRTLDSGRKYEELPELYMIFITEKDFLGLKTGLAKVERVIQGTGKTLDNGVREIYANLENLPVDDVQGRLLKYIRNTDERIVSVDGFYHLAERVRYLKNSEEGMRYMCELVEWERAEGKAEGKVEGKVEAIFDILCELGGVPGTLRKKVEGERDFAVLGRWVRLAARANSISEFEEMIKMEELQ